MKEFKDRLKELRKERGYTQSDLAKLLDCNRSLISQYEQGSSKPQVDGQYRLCEIFGVSMNYLNGKSDNRVELPKDDEIDISKKLKSLIDELDNNENVLFNGNEIDNDTKNLLVSSLKISFEMAKQMGRLKKVGD